MCTVGSLRMTKAEVDNNMESSLHADLLLYQSGSDWDGLSDEGSVCSSRCSSLGTPPHLTNIGQQTLLNPDNAPLVKCRWGCCGEVVRGLESLGWHVGERHAVAGPGGLFYCGWEGCTRSHRAFNARYKMLVHVRTHTNEKPHRCPTCHKSFTRAENLKIHARSHTGERPYACPVEGCGKAYSNSSDRFKHTRTHSVEKPYACKVPGCHKRYTDPSSLRKHVKTYRHVPVPQAQGGTCEADQRLAEVKGPERAASVVPTARLQVEDNWQPEGWWSAAGWYVAGWAGHTSAMLHHDFNMSHQEQDKPLDLSIAVRVRP